MPASVVPDKNSVFLNVPFDTGYERQFVALVAAIIALGRKPRCVLELPDSGMGRLSRVMKHLQQCEVSFHDLSRIGTPVRFNMPFELGLACAVTKLHGRHGFFLLEKKEHQIDKRLSDIKGIECLEHGGTVRGTVSCVLDVLRSRTGNPSPKSVVYLYKDLRRAADDLKKDYDRRNIYTPAIFGSLVEAALQLATRGGLLPET